MENLIKKIQHLTSDSFGNFLVFVLPGFALSILITALLAFVLQKIYVRYGTAVSNRKVFSRNFLLLSVTTMFIIMVIKSSLALSLGLIGALSIVRFRAAIKEPEELVYLFIAIAIGLGMGAGFTVLTVITFFIICTLVMIRGYFTKKEISQNLYLTISSEDASQVSMRSVIEVLNKNCSAVRLKRSDEAGRKMEASFSVECDDAGKLEETKSQLKTLNKDMSISFIDSSRDF